MLKYNYYFLGQNIVFTQFETINFESFNFLAE